MLLSLSIFLVYPRTNSGNKILFYEIGYLAVGIGLITEQLDTYRFLLNTTFGDKEAITNMFRENIPNNIKTDTKMQDSYFNSMAILWMKITAQHKLDMLDAYVTLASLKKTLPDLPDNEVKKISARCHHQHLSTR